MAPGRAAFELGLDPGLANLALPFAANPGRTPAGRGGRCRGGCTTSERRHSAAHRLVRHGCQRGLLRSLAPTHPDQLPRCARRHDAAGHRPARLALHLARHRSTSQTHRLAGPPRRRVRGAGHRQGLAGAAFFRRDPGRLRVGPWHLGRQVQRDGHPGSGRIPGQSRVQAAPDHLPVFRRR